MRLLPWKGAFFFALLCDIGTFLLRESWILG